MLAKVRFGPAGLPHPARSKGTVAGIEYCRRIGLGAMEVEFVHGVNMGQEAARQAGAAAKSQDVLLSCHAPYYINLCAKERAKRQASIGRIVDSARAAFWLSASPVVIHSGFYLGRSSEECSGEVFAAYEACLEQMRKLKIEGVALGAELTGRKSAYGSLEEIVALAEHFGLENVVPVIDFAHYHARHKRLATKQDYLEILDFVERRLGGDAGKNFHCHFSGIEAGKAGERRHLPVSCQSPPFAPLAQVWVENGWGGRLICESPLLENDAFALQEIYLKAACAR
ncbi:MAG: TIM barrel protein [Candidatus Micrarchaeota archaeon]|nr:TIM barrel protein [Candidatus Micrarchaeota archaeon]